MICLSLLFYFQFTSLEQAWVAMVKWRDGLGHLRKILPYLSPLQSPFLFLVLMEDSHFILSPFFTSHLQRALTSILSIICTITLWKSHPKYHFCHSTDEKTKNKEAIWLIQWQSSNRNPSLLTQVSELLQADHTGEIKWILCQSKFVLKPSNYIPKSDASKWTTMRVISPAG